MHRPSLKAALSHTDEGVRLFSKYLLNLANIEETILRRIFISKALDNLCLIIQKHPDCFSLEHCPFLHTYFPCYEEALVFQKSIEEDARKTQAEGKGESDFQKSRLQKRIDIYERTLASKKALDLTYALFYRELHQSVLAEPNKANRMRLLTKNLNFLYRINHFLPLDQIPNPEIFAALTVTDRVSSQSAVMEAPEVAVETPPLAPLAEPEKQEKKERKRKQKKKTARTSPVQPSPTPPAPEGKKKGLEQQERKLASPLDAICSSGTLPFDTLAYAERVLGWFEAPETMLAQDSYLDLSPAKQQRALWQHAFSTEIDRFLATRCCCRPISWNNPTTGNADTLYLIPAEVTAEGQPPEKGVFQYCFGADDNVCYHRFFGEKVADQFTLDFINQRFHEDEFPTLQQSAQLAQKRSRPFKQLPSSIVPEYDQITSVITLYDPVHKLRIKLFDLQQEES